MSMSRRANSALFRVLVIVGCSGQDLTSCLLLKGQNVPVGAAWVAQDGCNVCTCTNFGVECQSWKTCSNSNQLGQPGDPICMYGLSGQYTVGQYWKTDDGCNDCICTKKGMNCTVKTCANTGFAQPKPPGSEMEFMDCPYNDRLYRYGDLFLADDGCNTCHCIMPGNYATFPVCTTSPCNPVG